MSSKFSLEFSGRKTISTLLHLSPYFLRHLVFHPDIRNDGITGYSQQKKQKKYIAALYDSVLDIVLEGYAELMQEKNNPSTRQLFNHLFELTNQFDQFLDKHRNSDYSLKLKDVVESPSIKEQLNIFRNYVRTYGREDEIVTYIKNMFTNHYEHYVNLIRTEMIHESFKQTLDIVKMDSGWSSASAMEVIRLFNNHQPNERMLKEFKLIGTIVKFADDIGDIVCDIKRNHLNLFCSLVNDNPNEKKILYQSVDKNIKINFRWLNKYCHSTFAEYISIMESFYDQITSKKLRLVFELSIIPAIWGIHLDSEHIAAS